MSEVSKEKFLQAYGNLLAQSWGNPDLLKRFKAAPGKVLAEYGLDPEGAAIEVIKPGAGWNAWATCSKARGCAGGDGL
ncbi:hypothetical protein FBQ97_19625, partial [Acidobacteria bacterium ACD]|nr:hypothetical protein [Acidobacteria bacterium ACD]